MKKSIKTFLKHPTKDSSNRSANPAVIRASTILFNTMQELYQHERKIKKSTVILRKRLLIRNLWYASIIFAKNL